MRFFAPILCVVLFHGAALAQSVAPRPERPMAGTMMWLQGNLPCTPIQDPAVVLDTHTVPLFSGDLPAGQSAIRASIGEPLPASKTVAQTWRGMLPAALDAKSYSVRWKCGTTDPRLMQVAVIDVQPLVPMVERVTNGRVENPSGVQLEDTLTFTVRNLKAWKQIGQNSKTALHLYLEGTELANVVAAPISQDETTVQATLEVSNQNVTDSNKESIRQAWVRVLKLSRDSASRRIDASIGPAAGVPFPSADGQGVNISLSVFPSYSWVVVTLLVLIALAVIVLGKMSSLLRDSNGATDAPYSLAKHQMAVWFVVVIGSYLYVWMITGSFSAVSSTALILMGISGGTGLVATTLDQSKRDQAKPTKMALGAERDALDAELNDPATGLQAQLRAAAAGSAAATTLTDTIKTKLARLNEVKRKLSEPGMVAEPNQQWYLDLLSDENGVSVHRLQMAIWTVVLAIVFIRAVYTDILMPDFDATLLGLMGISSGAYIGFKFPEKPP